MKGSRFGEMSLLKLGLSWSVGSFGGAIEMLSSMRVGSGKEMGTGWIFTA